MGGGVGGEELGTVDGRVDTDGVGETKGYGRDVRRVADRKKFGFGPVLGPKGPPGPRSDRRTDRFETACTHVYYRTYCPRTAWAMLLLIWYT